MNFDNDQITVWTMRMVAIVHIFAFAAIILLLIAAWLDFQTQWIVYFTIAGCFGFAFKFALDMWQRHVRHWNFRLNSWRFWQ